MLHIGNVDHAQHDHGPRSDEAYAAIKAQDAQLRGKVWHQLQTEFPGRATLFVVSDHGLSWPRSSHWQPMRAVAATAFGSGQRANSKQVELLTQGGALMVYVLDQSHRDEIERTIAKAYSSAKKKASSRVLTQAQYKANGLATPAEDPHAPDLIVLAGKGYVFGDTSAGQIPASEKPEHHGSHGHDPREPDFQARDGLLRGAGESNRA